MNAQDVSTTIEDIVKTHAFKRIAHVSFLGVVDRYQTSHRPDYVSYSRADHSIGVMHLALRIVAQLHMNSADAKTLLVSALAHDLAHPAFSHSLEYAFERSERSLDHHEALGRLLHGGFPYSGELIRVLMKHGVDIDRVYSVVSGTDELSFFFNNPINIDTIDGISRPIWSEGRMAPYNIDVLIRNISLIYQGEPVSSIEFFRHADRFWQAKNNFYNVYLSGRIAAFEAEFQRSVRESVSVLDQPFFGMSDQEFLKLFPPTEPTPNEEDIRQPSYKQSFEIDGSVISVDKDTLSKRYKRVKRAIDRHLEEPSVNR